MPSLAIERHLLDSLQDIIPPGDAYTMDADRISRIASEPPEAQRSRAEAEAQKAALEDVISICQDFSTYGGGMYSLDNRNKARFF